MQWNKQTQKNLLTYIPPEIIVKPKVFRYPYIASFKLFNGYLQLTCIENIIETQM